MKNTLLRGKILRLLFDLYPDGLEHSSIVGIYYQYEKVEEIEKSIQYLCDKKLVEEKNRPHPYRTNQNVKWYKITANGVDLIEGTASADYGITVPMED